MIAQFLAAWLICSVWGLVAYKIGYWRGQNDREDTQ